MSSKHTLFLLIIIFSSSLFISPSCSTTNTNSSTKAKYTSFVETACRTTTYPPLCRKTCLPNASKIAGNSLKLATTALAATLTAAKSATSTVTALSRQKDLTKYEANVIRDCIEDMGESIDELKQSIDQIKSLGKSSNKKELRSKMSNIKTWMSACITNENTCMDELEEGTVSPRIKDNIRKSILGVAKLTSNALSLCNHLYN